MKSAECLSTDVSNSKYLGTVELKFQGVDVTPLHPTTRNNDPAIKNGGMSLSDLLNKEMADVNVAARASGVRRRLGRTKQSNGIAKLRLEAGLSQQQVADAMGLQQPAIARWERNPGAMSVDNLRALAKALNLSTSTAAQAIDEQLTTQQSTRLEHA